MRTFLDRFWFPLALLLFTALLLVPYAVPAQTAPPKPTVTLSVAVDPLNVPTVTWSSTNAVSCSATGGWSGTKATSGTERLAAITAVTTYSLLCVSDKGEAKLTWERPTTRTDGSALPADQLASFRLYVAGTNVSPAAPTETIAGNLLAWTHYAAPGARFFWLSAVDSAGRESLKTGSVTTTVQAYNAAASASATPIAPPSPPLNLQIVVPVVAGANMAPVFKLRADGTRQEQVAGYAPIGLSCTGAVKFTYRGDRYREVDPAHVQWWDVRPSERVYAPCREGG